MLSRGIVINIDINKYDDIYILQESMLEPPAKAESMTIQPYYVLTA